MTGTSLLGQSCEDTGCEITVNCMRRNDHRFLSKSFPDVLFIINERIIAIRVIEIQMIIFAQLRINSQILLSTLIKARSHLRLLLLLSRHDSVIFKGAKMVICLFTKRMLHLQNFKIERQENGQQINNGADLSRKAG